MIENYYEWYSQNIGGEFRMLVFGDRGIPVILFPSSMGTYYENKDRGMIDEVSWFVQEGLVKIYCPDSLDRESWYNDGVSPAIRVYNHTCYDNLILKEVVERGIRETGCPRVVTAGCSFGGYHAANFAFRHPELVSYMFSMSGVFNIKSRVPGYYDDNVYFNNPVDYLPDDQNPYLWKMGIVLGAADQDVCRQQNEDMSGILRRKSIQHQLDIRPNAIHDWPVWRRMFPEYLSKIEW